MTVTARVRVGCLSSRRFLAISRGRSKLAEERSNPEIRSREKGEKSDSEEKRPFRKFGNKFRKNFNAFMYLSEKTWFSECKEALASKLTNISNFIFYYGSFQDRGVGIEKQGGSRANEIEKNDIVGARCHCCQSAVAYHKSHSINAYCATHVDDRRIRALGEPYAQGMWPSAGNT